MSDVDDEIRRALRTAVDPPPAALSALEAVRRRGRRARAVRRVSGSLGTLALVGASGAFALSALPEHPTTLRTTDGPPAVSTATVSTTSPTTTTLTTTPVPDPSAPPPAAFSDVVAPAPPGPDTRADVLPAPPRSATATSATDGAGGPTTVVPTVVPPTTAPAVPGDTTVVASACGEVEVALRNGRAVLVAVRALPAFEFEAHDEDSAVVVEFHESPPECVVTAQVVEGRMQTRVDVADDDHHD